MSFHAETATQLIPLNTSNSNTDNVIMLKQIQGNATAQCTKHNYCQHNRNTTLSSVSTNFVIYINNVELQNDLQTVIRSISH